MMTTHTTAYAANTSTTTTMPWGVFVRARVLCPDGIVRRTKRIAQKANTFFSVPCAVTVRGKTVAGFMTFVEDAASGENAAVFRAYTYRKNHDVFTARESALSMQDLADAGYNTLPDNDDDTTTTREN